VRKSLSIYVSDASRHTDRGRLLGQFPDRSVLA